MGACFVALVGDGKPTSAAFAFAYLLVTRGIAEGAHGSHAMNTESVHGCNSRDTFKV